jgi:trimeric autotransporter adhesin
MGVAIDRLDNLYIADKSNNRIRKVSASSGTISTFVNVTLPQDVAVDFSGNVYIADTSNCVVRKVNVATGIMSVAAGAVGTCLFSGDGGAASLARLSSPSSVAVDRSGNVYIADTNNHRIRFISVLTWKVTTLAGNGTKGVLTEGVSARTATLSYPEGVAVDFYGNVYIADTRNNRVRVVANTTGIINTLAGAGSCCYNGEGLPATSAYLNKPSRVAVDKAGTVYIAEPLNNRVRFIPYNGQGNVFTFVGSRIAGYLGDGNDYRLAEVNRPSGIALDSYGNVYIADTYNHAVRKISCK